jgi:hypothetical protein
MQGHDIHRNSSGLERGSHDWSDRCYRRELLKRTEEASSNAEIIGDECEVVKLYGGRE